MKGIGHSFQSSSESSRTESEFPRQVKRTWRGVEPYLSLALTSAPRLISSSTALVLVL